MSHAPAPGAARDLGAAALKAEAQRRQADVVARWFAVNPGATCRPVVALAIAEMQTSVGRPWAISPRAVGRGGR